MKNLKEFKMHLQTILEKYEIDKSEADEILCEILCAGKCDLLFIENISSRQMRKANKILNARIKGVPVEKYLKRAYFLGDRFYVNKNVLTPRQDTEIVVDNCLKLIPAGGKVLDLCTGSGIIAISIAKRSASDVTAADISKKALKIAKRNAKNLKANVNFVLSDLFHMIDGRFDLIVSNPPYIKTQDILTLPVEVRDHDPLTALDGGLDGLHFYKKIAANAHKFMTKDAHLVLEIGYNQAKDVVKLLKKENYTDINVIKDYGGNDRVVTAKYAAPDVRINHKTQMK